MSGALECVRLNPEHGTGEKVAASRRSQPLGSQPMLTASSCGRIAGQIFANTGAAMIQTLQGLPPLAWLVIATILEVSGDAVVRVAIYKHSGAIRISLFAAGGALLLGYGSCLNLAPLDFGRVVGLYIATLFVVWQAINFIVFRALPSLPILVGGVLVIAGGAIITFWKPA